MIWDFFLSRKIFTRVRIFQPLLLLTLWPKTRFSLYLYLSFLYCKMWENDAYMWVPRLALSKYSMKGWQALNGYPINANVYMYTYIDIYILYNLYNYILCTYYILYNILHSIIYIIIVYYILCILLCNI